MAKSCRPMRCFKKNRRARARSLRYRPVFSRGTDPARSWRKFRKRRLRKARARSASFVLVEQAIPSRSLPYPPQRLLNTSRNCINWEAGCWFFGEQELYKDGCGFVNRFTKARIHFAVGLSIMIWALQDGYKDLGGSLLEGLAKLFAKMCVSVFSQCREANLQQWQRLARVGLEMGCHRRLSACS